MRQQLEDIQELDFGNFLRWKRCGAVKERNSSFNDETEGSRVRALI